MANFFRKTKDLISLLTVKPKTVLSLEQLKALHNILIKNIELTSENQSLLVESLHLISEILIWGDQHDPRVFDYFLENHTLLFFLNILKQSSSPEISIQLLQTLNILCENIKNKNSLYCFLSNNNINAIIIHQFDFDNEEITAYFISFLKTLSFKLDNGTINLFFDTTTLDFPLLTEAIKFFDHKDSMVRIAVQTLTLKVLEVKHVGLNKFLIERIIPAYIPNLIWKMGQQLIQMNAEIINFNKHKYSYIKDQISNFIDNLHYIKDIINTFDYEPISTFYIGIIIDNIIYNSLAAHYLYANDQKILDNLNILKIQLSLFLLIQHLNIFTKNQTIHRYIYQNILNKFSIKQVLSTEQFMEEPKPIKLLLEECGIYHRSYNLDEKFRLYLLRPLNENSAQSSAIEFNFTALLDNNNDVNHNLIQNEQSNIFLSYTSYDNANRFEINQEFYIVKCIKTYLNEFNCHSGFLMVAVCFLNCFLNLYIDMETSSLSAIKQDSCIDPLIIQPSNRDILKEIVLLIFPLLEMIAQSPNGIIMDAIDHCVYMLMFVKKIQFIDLDIIVAKILDLKENCKLQLRLIYNEAESYIDLFEEQIRKFHDFLISIKNNEVGLLNCDKIMRDVRFLLENQLQFQVNSVDSDELKYQRYWIIFIHLYHFLKNSDISSNLNNAKDKNMNILDSYDDGFINTLPKPGSSIDLSDSELTACTLIMQNQTFHENSIRAFISIGIDIMMILEANHSNKIGWGHLKMAFYLTNISISLDPLDSRCLNICALSKSSSSFPMASRLHRMSPTSAISAISSAKEKSVLIGKFVFEDYIRCMLVRQRIHRRIATIRRNRRINIIKWLELPEPSMANSLNEPNSSQTIQSESNIWSESSRSYIKKSPDKMLE